MTRRTTFTAAVLTVMAASAAAGAGGALAAAPAGHSSRPSGGQSSSTGYDISYPQCGAPYPSKPAFGIVGVNGGLANDANGCFASELSWAQGATGLTSPAQLATSLYVNTADPGPGTASQPIADWPAPSSTPTPYGACDGSWSQACAYEYGEQRASYSYGLVAGGYAGVASSAPWWLDIETTNSWATSGTPGYTGLNVATIQGFLDGLKAAGATPQTGIYSTAAQWQTITGLNAATTAAAFGGTLLPAWVAGGRSLKAAQSNCSGSFTGGRVALAQYASGGFDADLACP